MREGGGGLLWRMVQQIPGQDLAMNFGDKCCKMRWKKISSPRISYSFLRWMRWIAVNYLFSQCSQYSYKKEASVHGFELLSSCMPSISYSTAPIVKNFYYLSCKFKSSSVNVGRQIRRIFVQIAAKFLQHSVISLLPKL